MINYNYKRKDFIKMLNANGFYIKPKSGKGSHVIYSNGSVRIPVPYHGKEIKGVLANSIIKKYNLKGAY